jgi:hypothetical protein
MQHELAKFGQPQPRVEETISQLLEVDLSTIQQSHLHGSAYLRYFEIQTGLARQNDNPLNPICTQKNMLAIVQHLKAGKWREVIRNELGSNAHHDANEINDYYDNAIDLAIRLWLMIHIGTVPLGITGQTGIVWGDGSLKDAMSSHFRHETILTDSVKFQKIFNARNIERIADVKIQWTPNLVDHLRFVEDGRKPVLNIFYCAELLEMQKEKYVSPYIRWPDFVVKCRNSVRCTHHSSSSKRFLHLLSSFQLTISQPENGSENNSPNTN